MDERNLNYDVVIIGAGISGINAAYRIQTELPESTYTILEARDHMGGTWDLFKYPGIRSDSDLYTFGFPWRPWKKNNPIADGPSIVNYMKECTSAEGIDKHIKYHHKVTEMNWSSDEQMWKLTVDHEEKSKCFRAKFVILGTGYYNYNEPLAAKIPGLENFKGQIIHPQFWPEDFDCVNKKVIIIGSGATAITLLPNVAKQAEKTTIVQRSPSYILSVPNFAGSWYDRWVPTWLASKITRFRFLLFPFLFFKFCRAYPNAARKMLQGQARKQLPETILIDPHFEPKYNPWEQRLCVCPDGDFYKCLKEGKAEIVTGNIKRVTEHGMTLESGQQLEADIIITATGLKVQMGGGAHITVDNQPLIPSEKFLWRGMMLQDLPNASFVIGYTNASWTLGADTTAIAVCRILKEMKKTGATSVTPQADHPERMKAQPILNLNSTYIEKAKGELPKGGDRGPWRPRDNYFQDYYRAKYGDIHTGLRYDKVST